MTIPSTSSVATSASDFQAHAQQRRADFQALTSALQSGDLNAAQQAFTQLQKDNPRLAQALASADTSGNPRLADLKSIGDALQSGDIGTAQQAFAKLQTDAQAVQGGRHHHHHHADASGGTMDADGDNDGSGSVGSQLNATA